VAIDVMHLEKSPLRQTIWVVLVNPKVFAIIVFFHAKTIVLWNQDKSERSEQGNSNMLLNDSEM
jgi:hypothetical protein